MKTAIAILTALLLFVSSCSTTRKAAEKETMSRDQAASIEQTATTTETTAATFDQAALEQILQRINITFDFERWEFDPGSVPPTPPEEQPATFPEARDREEADKPPNAGRPTSLTKGSLKINSEGSQNRATQTTAGTQTEKADSVGTKAQAEKKEAGQKETSQQTKTKKNSPAPFFAFLAMLIAAGLYFFGKYKASKP